MDTYRGVRAWGWSPPLALLTALIINLNLSYPTVLVPSLVAQGRYHAKGRHTGDIRWK